MAFALALAAGTGCSRAPASAPAGGNIDVRWTGGQRGSISAPATAEWCAVLRLLEVSAIRGDTGVALAVYARDTLSQGTFRIVPPARAESLPPAAGIALRWPTQTAIIGFQGESGSVVLERTRSGELSGRISAAARAVNDTAVIRIEGTFQNLAIRPQSRGCIRPPKVDSVDPQPPDTSLH
jgi:hypothetical protein